MLASAVVPLSEPNPNYESGDADKHHQDARDPIPLTCNRRGVGFVSVFTTGLEKPFKLSFIRPWLEGYMEVGRRHFPVRELGGGDVTALLDHVVGMLIKDHGFPTNRDRVTDTRSKVRRHRKGSLIGVLINKGCRNIHIGRVYYGAVVGGCDYITRRAAKPAVHVLNSGKSIVRDSIALYRSYIASVAVVVSRRQPYLYAVAVSACRFIEQFCGARAYTIGQVYLDNKGLVSDISPESVLGVQASAHRRMTTLVGVELNVSPLDAGWIQSLTSQKILRISNRRLRRAFVLQREQDRNCESDYEKKSCPNEDDGFYLLSHPILHFSINIWSIAHGERNGTGTPGAGLHVSFRKTAGDD